MINWDQIRQLEEDVGAEDLGDVVTLFLAEVDEAIEELPGISKESEKQVEAALHFLKGSAFNLGFEAFGDICAAGETAAQNGSTEGISFDEIVSAYNASKSVFLADAAKHCSLELD